MLLHHERHQVAAGERAPGSQHGIVEAIILHFLVLLIEHAVQIFVRMDHRVLALLRQDVIAAENLFTEHQVHHIHQHIAAAAAVCRQIEQDVFDRGIFGGPLQAGPGNADGVHGNLSLSGIVSFPAGDIIVKFIDPEDSSAAAFPVHLIAPGCLPRFSDLGVDLLQADGLQLKIRLRAARDLLRKLR